MVHHYCERSLPHHQRECVMVSQSALVTHMYMHIHMLTHVSHIHSHMCTVHTSCVIPTLCSTDVLKIFVPFFQDGSGWQHVETSLSENKHLNTLWLDGCDAFIVSMLRALAMGRNTSIQDLCLYSESLYYVTSHDTLI